MKILSALILLASTNAIAGDLVIHTVSRHTDNNHTTSYQWYEPQADLVHTHTDYAYNNNNYGIGYRSDTGWLVGVYHNSYFRPTAYVGKEWMYNQYFGGQVALATGYDSVAHRPVVLIGGLIVRFPIYDGVKGNFLLVPPVANTDGVVHFALNYPF